MIQLNNINLQINSVAMLSKLNSNMPITFAQEDENAIVHYDDNLRQDIFYSDLSEENKTVWNNYINMCLNKTSITKEELGQIINQYDIERIIVNTINILVDSNKQFIIEFNELSTDELLILTNFNEMIKTLL